MKTKTFKILSTFCLIALFLPTSAQATVIFSTEEGVTNADTFVIDKDDSSTDYIKLQFGDTIDAYLRYDIVSDELDINKDINFNQFQGKNFVMHRGTAVPGSGTGGQLFYDTDNDIVYYHDGTSWVAMLTGNSTVDADTLDSLDSTQFVRSDTSDTYTSGTLNFANGTSLQIDNGGTLDINAGATANIPETTANVFTLDSDNTGGNVSLTFGESLGETLTWDNTDSRFEFSNNLEVQGDTRITGNLTASGDVIIGNDDTDTLDINAKLSDNLDFNQNQALNMVVHSGTSFPASPVEGQKFYRSDLNVEYIYNGSDWQPTNSTTGSGKVIVFAPIYEDATLYADGTNNSGTMAVDHDATANRNYYEWSSRKGTNQDYDIALQVTLPDDFSEWQATPFELAYKTDSGATLSKIDVSMEDTAGAAVTLTNNTNLNNAAGWTTTNMDITGSPTWTAGERFNIFIKMTATRSGGTQYKPYAGELILKYYTN
jgi:hypothetical protein